MRQTDEREMVLTALEAELLRHTANRGYTYAPTSAFVGCALAGFAVGVIFTTAVLLLLGA